MRKTYFVAGTDTGVGKTQITAALLAAANKKDLRTIGLKPLAAGCELSEGVLKNDDAVLLQSLSSVSLPYQQVNPVALAEPVAPHIAAAESGSRLSVQRLEGYCRGALMAPHDISFIEGAGGWRVPLNEQENLSGLPKAMNVPVILVVGLRLGCLNHAILTAESICRDGLRIAGWVANSMEKGMPREDENIGTLRYRLPFPFLGHVPHLDDVSPEAVAAYLSLDALAAD